VRAGNQSSPLPGFAPSEAAVICGVSAEAMRQRLSRARDMLDHRLNGDIAALRSLKEATT